uniref:Uncharacterized protein n=1 Tax=Pipistrellus kuhlii TaxID=59472 RepID=A0A7J7RVX6_PIPKU|nr:hypothetical protein mPipKuh1_010229 [Pipistrellus kuhlii]
MVSHRGGGHGHCAGLSLGPAFSVRPRWPAERPGFLAPAGPCPLWGGGERGRQGALRPSAARTEARGPQGGQIKVQIWVGEQIKETPRGDGGSASPSTTCRAPSPPEGAEGTPPLTPRRTHVWSLLGRGGGGGGGRARGQVAGLKPQRRSPFGHRTPAGTAVEGLSSAPAPSHPGSCPPSSLHPFRKLPDLSGGQAQVGGGDGGQEAPRSLGRSPPPRPRLPHLGAPCGSALWVLSHRGWGAGEVEPHSSSTPLRGPVLAALPVPSDPRLLPGRPATCRARPVLTAPPAPAASAWGSPTVRSEHSTAPPRPSPAPASPSRPPAAGRPKGLASAPLWLPSGGRLPRRGLCRGPAPNHGGRGRDTPSSLAVRSLGLKGPRSCTEEPSSDPKAHTESCHGGAPAPGRRPRPTGQPAPGWSRGGGPGARGRGAVGRSPGPARSPFSCPGTARPITAGHPPTRTRTRTRTGTGRLARCRRKETAGVRPQGGGGRVPGFALAGGQGGVGLGRAPGPRARSVQKGEKLHVETELEHPGLLAHSPGAVSFMDLKYKRDRNHIVFRQRRSWVSGSITLVVLVTHASS